MTDQEAIAKVLFEAREVIKPPWAADWETLCSNLGDSGPDFIYGDYMEQARLALEALSRNHNAMNDSETEVLLNGNLYFYPRD